MGLLFISSMLTSGRVFMWFFMWGTVFSHVCKCRCRDVISVLLYVRMCVLSLLRPLEFPENPDSTHLIATHHIVTPSPRYGTRSAYPAFPFPFTLPSSLFLLRTFFCCSIHTFFCRRLHFIGVLLRGCFSKSVSMGHKLVIIQS